MNIKDIQSGDLRTWIITTAATNIKSENQKPYNSFRNTTGLVLLIYHLEYWTALARTVQCGHMKEWNLQLIQMNGEWLSTFVPYRNAAAKTCIYSLHFNNAMFCGYTVRNSIFHTYDKCAMCVCACVCVHDGMGCITRMLESLLLPGYIRPGICMHNEWMRT